MATIVTRSGKGSALTHAEMDANLNNLNNDKLETGAVVSSGLEMSTDRLLGRTTASTGAVEEITVGSGLSLSSGTLTATGAGVSDGDYGDVTVSSSGTVWTVDNDAVTYAKIQNVSATDKLLGRSTAGAGDIEEITCTAAGRALLDDASASAQRTTLGLEIGTDVQAFDADTAKTDVAQTFSAAQTFGADVTLNAQSDLRFADSDSSNWVAFQAPATVASNVTWTLPDADGSSGQVLSTNGTGTLSWATAGGGGGGELQQDAYDNLYAGDNALSSWTGTVSSSNVVIGTNAGLDVTDGLANVCIGLNAGKDLTTGNRNIVIGSDPYSGSTGATGSDNICMGRWTGFKHTTASANVFIGARSGESNTTGAYNVYLGELAGRNTTTGTDNVYLGRQSGQSGNGYRNIAIGYRSGTGVSGTDNTVIGSGAGYGVGMSGTNNIVLGYDAFASSTSVSNEITLGNASITSFRIPGLQAGATNGDVLTYNSTNGNLELATPSGGGGELQQDSQNNLYAGNSAWQSYTSTTNGHCIAIGETAGQNTTTSNESVFIGRHAGEDVTTGSNNVGIGTNCFNNTVGVTGSYNIAIAGQLGCGEKLTSGASNIFIGSRNGANMTTGLSNVIIGDNAGRGVTTATYNVFLGYFAGQNANGARNVCIGHRAGTVATGSDNTIVGSGAQYNTTLSGTNNTLIGHDAFASSTTVNNEITLGDTNIATLRCNQTSITSLSDGRDKINVAQLGEGLDFIARLKPVKFEWKTRDGNSKDGTYEAGFIAQDLQQAQQDADAEYLGLVMDSNPDRLEASYGKLVPVLVRAIQELKAEIDTLKAHAVSQTR